jgi:hypothetical protein
MGQFFEVNALEFTIQPFIRLLWQIADEERFERVEAKIRDGLGGQSAGKVVTHPAAQRSRRGSAQ